MRRPKLKRIFAGGLLFGSLMLVYTSITNTLPEDNEVTAGIKGFEKESAKGNIKTKSVENSNKSFLPGSYRVWGFSNDIFLLSVVVGNSSSGHVWDHITIQGWEHLKYEKTSIICCVLYKSGSIQSVNTTSKLRWTLDKNTKMVAKQYVCPNNVDGLKDPPKAVTISGGTKPACHRRHNWYLRPHYAQAHKKEIAVCTKVVSRNTLADDILAWFEVHRRLGVKKVLVYTYDIDPSVGKILQHYKSVGMAELISFRLPQKDQGEQLVEIGPKDIQAWNIEQTLMNDCFVRSNGYKHVVVLDVDEYLIPIKAKTWPELFDKLWKKSPNAAGFSFKVNIHVTSGAVTNTISKFTAGKYTNRTGALAERMKHVIRPDRLPAGGLSTNSFTSGKGYRGFWVSEADATVHHFRSCKTSNDWDKDIDKTCQNPGRFRDMSVANIFAPLENGVMKLKASILNNGHH
ncbi:uncharacterized protein LOC123560982 [Mercenaria mercenaria]|uniref:uncharacterized protein LOC123560982 n=1 Tax=Mercenaria mercenaria TaxID=6596 RepID=UPI00234FAFB1|nr:uncharacterized protein LOC123560982 [Mercenaria mercenaria]XP_053408127.1 uncharacterized protein LOC123560982 [Mercenaria mercenaria]